MKFGTRIRQKISINTINEKVIDTSKRELHNIIIDILRTIPRIDFFGYKLRPVDPEEDFRLTNVDYLHKTKSDRIHIDLSEDVIDAMDIYFLMQENRVSEKYLNHARANARREVPSLDLDYYCPKKMEEVMNYDKGFIYQENDPKTKESMFVKITLYVPRLKNNVLILNGNHYFNKYYLNEGARMTRNGQLIMQHHSYTSYLSIKDDIFQISIFGKVYNPFHFYDPTTEFIEQLLDIDDVDKKAYFTKVIKNTIEDFETFESDIDIDMDIDDKRSIISRSDIMEGLNKFIYCTMNGNAYEDTLSLHTTLKKHLRIVLIQALKMGGVKQKRVELSQYKATLNVDPRMICTIIKKYKQYSLSKSTNEVDVYNYFGYVSTMEDSEDSVSGKTRNFTKAQLGMLCPLGSSSSADNIGLSGMLVFSVDDKKLRIVE